MGMQVCLYVCLYVLAVGGWGRWVGRSVVKPGMKKKRGRDSQWGEITQANIPDPSDLE